MAAKKASGTFLVHVVTQPAENVPFAKIDTDKRLMYEYCYLVSDCFSYTDSVDKYSYGN
jgi:hypothetical protein